MGGLILLPRFNGTSPQKYIEDSKELFRLVLAGILLLGGCCCLSFRFLDR